MKTRKPIYLALGIAWIAVAVLAFLAQFVAMVMLRPGAMICCLIAFGLAREFAWYCLDHFRRANGLRLLNRQTAEVME